MFLSVILFISQGIFTKTELKILNGHIYFWDMLLYEWIMLNSDVMDCLEHFLQHTAYCFTFYV